jgi:phosphatidylcholine synthase
MAIHPRARAWLLHSFTALGVVVGLLALVQVFDRDARAAIGWLLVATIIDGVDGPLARSWAVAEALPQIDGHVLDAVVDFLNTVVVPLVFVWRFDMLPHELALPVVSLALFTSALWFSRRDMMTEDGWFKGFPAAWNLVVPTLFLLHDNPVVGAVAVTSLALLQLSPVKFVHPVRVAELRVVTLSFTALWFVSIALLADLSPELPGWGPFALLAGPAYQVLLTVRRTLFSERLPGAEVVTP